MQTTFIRFMQEFAGRKSLARKIALDFRDVDGRPRIYCDEPAVVARFASQLRQEVARQHPGLKVLLRGQRRDHPGMVPSLFRPTKGDIAVAAMATLLKAEEEFAADVVGALPRNTRFARPHLPALLQHYGYRTRWLDVVDHLSTAVWFASSGRSADRVQRSSDTESGWLYFLTAVEGCEAVDLRTLHHGLSLRPHTQAGWSIRGCNAIDDLDEMVVACVEFPVNKNWKLDGYMASAEFLFPASRLDDTLKRLQASRIDDLAADVEARFDLPDRTLGRLDISRSRVE